MSEAEVEELTDTVYPIEGETLTLFLVYIDPRARTPGGPWRVWSDSATHAKMYIHGTTWVNDLTLRAKAIES